MTRDSDVYRKLANMSQDALDELVHLFKAAEAADINNGGKEEQIAYLLSSDWRPQS